MAKRGKSPRAQVPLRIPEALRARLEKAAKAGKVSMNAEIVERLQRSFETEDRLGGPRAVELIETIAVVMKLTGESAGVMESGKLAKQGKWLSLPYAFDQAAQAAITILKRHAEPLGKIVEPEPNIVEVVDGDPKEAEKQYRWMVKNLGEMFAFKEMRDREKKK